LAEGVSGELSGAKGLHLLPDKKTERPTLPTSPDYWLCVWILDRTNLVSTWAFLTLTNGKLNGLAVIQRSVTAVCLNFGMVDKQVLATVFRCNEAEAFLCAEPLNCTFTHINLYSKW
jgi:hypothetical protein